MTTTLTTGTVSNAVENAAVTIPVPNIPTPVKQEIPANVVFDGRSTKILETLQSMVAGLKATDTYIKTVAANQTYLLERMDIVLEVLGKEGIDFKEMTDAARTELQKLGGVTVATAKPKKASATPAENAEAKKRGRVPNQRGTAGFTILETLFNSADRRMLRSVLKSTVEKAGVINPYAVIRKLEATTPALISMTTMGVEASVQLTSAGVEFVNTANGKVTEPTADIVANPVKTHQTVADARAANPHGQAFRPDDLDGDDTDESAE